MVLQERAAGPVAPRAQLEQRLGGPRRVGLMEEGDGKGEASISLPAWLDGVSLTHDWGLEVGEDSVTSTEDSNSI